jgi:hypothetical protein
LEPYTMNTFERWTLVNAGVVPWGNFAGLGWVIGK